MSQKPLLIALALVAFIGSAEAQWKWRDAKGNVQYSDIPPPAGTPEKDVLQRPAGARPAVQVLPIGGAEGAASAASAPRAAASAPSKAEAEAAARQKQEKEQQAAKQKEEERRVAEKKRENCQRAQAGLRDLQSGTRITRTNERGERVYMDEAQIAAETARVRDIATSECR